MSDDTIPHQDFTFDVWPRKGKQARVELNDPRRQAPRMIPKGAIRVVLSLGIEGRAEPLYLKIGVDPSRPQARREGKDAALLTSEALRAIAIGTLIDRALEWRSTELKQELDQLDLSSVPEPIRQSFERRLAAARKASAKGSKGRRGHQLDHYEEVARVYLAAKARPTLAVMDHFEVERSTANKWVGRARHDFGLIPQTSPGKASGLTEQKKRTTTRRKR